MIKKFDVFSENKKELKKQFNIFDEKKKGYLKKKEIIQLMRKTKLNKNLPEIYILIKDLDLKENLNFEEFFNLISLNFEISENEIEKYFEIFDKEKKNFINFENFKKIEKDFKIKFDDVLIADILDKCDFNKDGKFCYDDFRNILLKK